MPQLRSVAHALTAIIASRSSRRGRQPSSGGASTASPSAATVRQRSTSTTAPQQARDRQQRRRREPAPRPAAMSSYQYGDLEVKVTMTGSTITDVSVAQPTSRPAVCEHRPVRGPAAAHRGAERRRARSIDGVSGASYTSAAYQQSLQSAIDKLKPRCKARCDPARSSSAMPSRSWAPSSPSMCAPAACPMSGRGRPSAEACAVLHARRRGLQPVQARQSAQSRLRRGEIELAGCPPRGRGRCVELCEQAQASVRGLVRPVGACRAASTHRPRQGLGGARGRRACCEAAGLGAGMVNAAGDIVGFGAPVGSARPGGSGSAARSRPTCSLCVVELRGAVATSGNYERGDHIRDVRPARPPQRRCRRPSAAPIWRSRTRSPPACWPPAGRA